jgi:hypothetical protein
MICMSLVSFFLADFCSNQILSAESWFSVRPSHRWALQIRPLWLPLQAVKRGGRTA